MKDLLQPIRNRLCSPDRWIKRRYSRTNSVGVVAYCLLGASIRNPGLNKHETHKVQNELNRRVELAGSLCTIDWNDDPARTFEDVQELLKEPFYD